MTKKIDLVLLAGGRGSRIKDYLKSYPKPMINVNGNRFLFLLLKYFSKYVTGNIYILAGYRGQKIKKLYHKKLFNFCEVNVLIEKKTLGTGGAVYSLKNKIKNNFILINADTFFPINLKKFVDKSNKKKLVHIALSNNKNYKSNEKLTNLNYNKKKELFLSQKKTKYMNGGIYYIKRKIFSYMYNKIFSLEEFLMNDLIKKNMISAEYFGEPFIDIGTPKNLRKANRFLRKFYQKPAIIFDRDNTLTYDKGYTHKPNDLIFKPKIINYLKHISKKKSFIFIATNQSGIGKDKFKLDDFYNFQKKMKNVLIKKNIFIDDVKFCPFHPKAKIKKYRKNSKFRKPGNHMIIELLKEWKFNEKKSLVIGDNIKDEQMAKKSKIKFLYAQDITSN